MSTQEYNANTMNSVSYMLAHLARLEETLAPHVYVPEEDRPKNGEAYCLSYFGAEIFFTVLEYGVMISTWVGKREDEIKNLVFRKDEARKIYKNLREYGMYENSICIKDGVYSIK